MTVAQVLAHRLVRLAATEWSLGRIDFAEEVLAFTLRGLDGAALPDCDDCDEDEL